MERFENFAAGRWGLLLKASRKCDEDASVAHSRKRRRHSVDSEIQRRCDRAQELVQLGELSSGRQALEGASLAPGSEATFAQLTNPTRRPPHAREPMPQVLMTHEPEVPFELEEMRFLQNLRSAKKGAAGGPSGMTTDHLRPVLDNVRDSHLFFTEAEQLSRAYTPQVIVNTIRMGRMTALQKDDGGVRGTVAGDIIRRLVACTVAQQLSPVVERVTTPFQYAMTTRAGTECVAHALQALTEADPTATLMSLNGVSAFDLTSRRAMLESLAAIPVGSQALPFVRMFCGSPSSYLWEGDSGVTTIEQGEGREQGDPTMPLLFSLGQHAALHAVQGRLEAGERLFAFLDDIWVVTAPDRVGPAYIAICEASWARIRVHVGKTKVWNSGSPKPPGLHTTARELQTCTFQGPSLQKHHENSTRRPPKRGKKERQLWQERKTKREILAPHPAGPHPSRPHPSGPHFSRFALPSSLRGRTFRASLNVLSPPSLLPESQSQS